MQTKKNIIKKLTVEVNTNSMKTALHYKNNLTEIFNKMEPQFDEIFSNYSTGDLNNYLRFENLELDIDLTKNNTDEDLRNKILKAIKLKLSSLQNKNEKVSSLSFSERYIEAFFYFLEFGKIPWWFQETFFEIKKLIPLLKDQTTINKFKLILHSNTVRYRLIHQFDDPFLLEICTAFSGKSLTKKNTLMIQKIASGKTDFWALLINGFLEQNEEKSIKEIRAFTINSFKYKTILTGNEVTFIFNFFSLFNSLYGKELLEIKLFARNEYKSYGVLFQKEKSNIFFLNKTQIAVALQKRGAKFLLEHNKPTSPYKKPKPVTGKKENESEIYIENAGLILLHPFLKPFFEKINLFENNRIKESNYDLAVQILYYLATNKEQAAEHQLIFEKYLCGIPAGFPLNKFVSIPQQIKTECDELLQAVLTHWKSLQSSSSILLQNEYLCRPGKLTLNNDKDILYIQRKTQDILLEKIPWNIHIIKLPWNKKLLYVEW